jgi:hypothetical protein
VIVLVSALGSGMGSLTAATAATPCPNVSSSLTITQTSALTDLAPGVSPAFITGNVTYNGNDTTSLGSVTATITSVTKASNAGKGRCDASDYVLSQQRMTVNRTLTPDLTVPCSGATLAFSDKNINQDACQGATIHLRYEATR